jgi:F-type H+-transporting ATPase subunit gamma
MSDTLERLRRKIEGAEKLGSVVRTMKTLSASSVGQYETAVTALGDYYRAVQLGLVACFRSERSVVDRSPGTGSSVVAAVVFGSDQGLVGRFNEALADFVVKTLGASTGERRIRVVGERIHARLTEIGWSPVGQFPVPTSVEGISPLVGQLLLQCEADRVEDGVERIGLFYNRPVPGGSFEPVGQLLLPLDEKWRRELIDIRWPTNNLPELFNGLDATLPALIREYLFVSLFRACAESLASEHASRLSAMRRAENNIDELLDELRRTFHLVRQTSIDEELFDVISGFEALSGDESRRRKTRS